MDGHEIFDFIQDLRSSQSMFVTESVVDFNTGGNSGEQRCVQWFQQELHVRQIGQAGERLTWSFFLEIAKAYSCVGSVPS
jgi:hypothetical protein